MTTLLYETWHRTYLGAGISGAEHGWIRKPLVEGGICAEIAVRNELASLPGWDAVWVRNAVGGGRGFLRFWRTMPSNLSARDGGETELPAWPSSVLDEIDKNWRSGGVLDVFAWNEATHEVRFAEAKRRGRDRLRTSQVDFIRHGLEAGHLPRSFIVVEWDTTGAPTTGDKASRARSHR